MQIRLERPRLMKRFVRLIASMSGNPVTLAANCYGYSVYIRQVPSTTRLPVYANAKGQE